MDFSLSWIQQKLKAPKSQFNKFGNYNYRNCEDILEALKPLISEMNVSIIISDELIQIGDRYYVKASSYFIDDNGKVVSPVVTAYAREAENKKGMDDSQVTGSTSSYSRKYSLNGLLAIEDTKDADHNGRKEEPKPEPKPEPKSESDDLDLGANRMTEPQRKKLYAMMRNYELTHDECKSFNDWLKNKFGHEHLTKFDVSKIFDGFSNLFDEWRTT